MYRCYDRVSTGTHAQFYAPGKSMATATTTSNIANKLIENKSYT